MRLITFRHAPVICLCLLSGIALSLPSASSAQTPTTGAAKPAAAATAPTAPTADEKAEDILRRAVAALGGGAYTSIKSVTGRGYFSQIAGGVAAPPMTFTDYLIYPDRERTDFKSQGVHDIQTNLGAGQGWVFDGMTKTISDMKPEQLENFRVTMRTSVDNLLRGEWRKENASLTYLGRREAGLAKRNEAVRLTYPDGFIVDFEFGARDALPAKVTYKHTIKVTKEGVEEEKEVTEEDQIVRYLTFGGVQVPYTIDHYRDGVQTSRINYDSVEFNQPIPETLFAKPTNPKLIK
jgi:hypothetical protein